MRLAAAEAAKRGEAERSRGGAPLPKLPPNMTGLAK